MTTAAEKAVETDKTTAPDKRKALGRGLESLLPGGPRVVAGTAASLVAPGATSIVLPEIQAQAARAAAGDLVLPIRPDDIEQNHYQTRDPFDTQMMPDVTETPRATRAF